jgi:putative iron-only hydrogenase system regulator
LKIKTGLHKKAQTYKRVYLPLKYKISVCTPFCSGVTLYNQYDFLQYITDGKKRKDKSYNFSGNFGAFQIPNDVVYFPKIQRTERRIDMTESRVALIGIIVSSKESVEQLNHLLSEYGNYIIGRMGLPYKERNISIISVAMDAPGDVINALTGKLGMLPGISTKTIYPKNG